MLREPLLDIKPDVLIFSCNQAYQARMRPQNRFDSHLRFEPFLFGTHEWPKVSTFEEFYKLLNVVLKHHSEVCPQVRRKESVNLENISHFSTWIATTFADVEHIIRHFTSHPPPNRPAQIPTSYLSYPLLKAAIDDFREGKTTSSETWAAEFWHLLDTCCKTHFSPYHSLLFIYGHWKYNVINEDAGEEDYYRRPPVGDAFYKKLKSGALFPPRLTPQHKDMNNSCNSLTGEAPPDVSKPFPKAKSAEHHISSHTSLDGKSSRSAPTRTETASSHSQPQTRNNNDSYVNPLTLENYNKKEPQRVSHVKSKLGLKSEEKTPPEVVAQALSEVKEAVKKLEISGDQEVMLAPQNSYVRRLQHTLASELGLKTESYGFGKQRCVILSKLT